MAFAKKKSKERNRACGRINSRQTRQEAGFPAKDRATRAQRFSRWLRLRVFVVIVAGRGGGGGSRCDPRFSLKTCFAVRHGSYLRFNTVYSFRSTKTHYASPRDHATRFLLGNQDRIPPAASARPSRPSSRSLVSASSLLAACNAIIYLSLVMPPTFDRYNRINVAFRLRTFGSVNAFKRAPEDTPGMINDARARRSCTRLQKKEKKKEKKKQTYSFPGDRSHFCERTGFVDFFFFFFYIKIDITKHPRLNRKCLPGKGIRVLREIWKFAERVTHIRDRDIKIPRV